MGRLICLVNSVNGWMDGWMDGLIWYLGLGGTAA